MDEQFLELFKIKNNRKDIKVGSILIAEPFHNDPFYARTIILLTHLDTSGVTGLILNKLLNPQISDMKENFEGVDCKTYLGGLTQVKKVTFLHTNPDITGTSLVGEGIYGGGDLGQLTRMLRSGEMSKDEAYCFIGCVKWTAAQLLDELEKNKWMVGTIRSTQFFQISNENLWEDAMNRLGGKHRIWADFPLSPRMN